LEQFEARLHLDRLMFPTSRVVIAVSGGMDSMVLLHAFVSLAPKYGWDIRVCHVDHGLRPQSPEDAQFVHDVCQRWRVPCHGHTIDPSVYATAKRQSVQVTARALRYAALIATAKQENADTIAVAHHRDDQVETVLMRLLQGTGIAGLAAMRTHSYYANRRVIRPFLHIPHAGIAQYAQEQDVPFREDASNTKTVYFRNAVRLEILPYLRQFRPHVDESLFRLSDICAGENEYIESQAHQALARLMPLQEPPFAFQRQQFLAEPTALQRRMIKILLTHLYANDAQAIDWECVVTLQQRITQDHPTTGQWQVSQTVTCVREYDTVSFHTADHRRTTPDSAGYRIVLDVHHEGKVQLPYGLGDLSWTLPDTMEFPRNWHTRDANEAFFAQELLCRETVVVRTRRLGDRIALWAHQGTQKVKEVMINAKVPLRQRNSWPMVAWDG
jgi:tRNA(Ile)-lysidine synthase